MKKINLDKLNTCPVTKMNAIGNNTGLNYKEKAVAKELVLAVDNESNIGKAGRKLIGQRLDLGRDAYEDGFEGLLQKGIIEEIIKGNGFQGVSVWKLNPMMLIEEFEYRKKIKGRKVQVIAKEIEEAVVELEETKTTELSDAAKENLRIAKEWAKYVVNHSHLVIEEMHGGEGEITDFDLSLLDDSDITDETIDHADLRKPEFNTMFWSHYMIDDAGQKLLITSLPERLETRFATFAEKEFKGWGIIRT
ncbi:hypothetical protein CGI18_07160 [Vibrio parahaemolyticus]|uniref:hypothetical protein n=1 Tax=Vibrio parahaemolyticus TaxID=670 RepID=UPI00111E5855|nr:hypothetical protein [Vibrio parahaemolyticus]TOK48263.1 hypothetical protein CGI18_07160 [Vibrio parahaemolyticus]